MRQAIGKDLSEDQFLQTLDMCSEAGIENMKIYFIINLPTETLQDIGAISDLLNSAIQKIYSPQHLSLSINPFIPKPHTPFQWEPSGSLSYFQKTSKILQTHLKKLKIYDTSFLDPRWARIQGFLSRGTHFLAPILVKVLQTGGTLGAWRTALKEANWSIDESQLFQPKIDEDLPWDFIDVNVKKTNLLKLFQKTHT